MAMFATNSSSPFQTNLTLETRTSFRDASFSSYLYEDEETTIAKLTNPTPNFSNHHYPLQTGSINLDHKAEDDHEEEIGVFGAEKYFKGEMEDENFPRLLENDTATKTYDQQQQPITSRFVSVFPVKQQSDRACTPSDRSESSWNSRSGLLPLISQRSQAGGRKIEKVSKTRRFLAVLGCNCMNKSSTEISDKRFLQAKEISKPLAKTIAFDQKTDLFSSKWPEDETKEDYFSFQVFNSNSKPRNLAGKVHEEDNGPLTLERKLSLLTDWGVGAPREEGMYSKEAESDASSDLFEIESLSTTGNSSFFARQTSESNCYEPSEVSIEWSVVTASVADFSVASDYEDVRNGRVTGESPDRKAEVKGNYKDKHKKRAGIIGCTSHKAVRVSGDGYQITGSEKVLGGGGSLASGRRRQSDSVVAAVGRFRGENNLIGFDHRRGSYGSDASQMLYVKQ